MTGIERLRELTWNVSDVGGRKYRGGFVVTTVEDIDAIADQIERELQEERDRWDEELCDAQMDKTRVMAAYLEMNKHVSGVEGAEDSPVARWARELRDALKSDTSDGAEQQKPSCANAAETADVTLGAAKVTPADREAIAWVREHGGLERVKAQRRESIPRAAYERKKSGFLDHIAECETALGKRREAIARLADENDALRLERAQMRPRLMPEGMEWLIKAWPRFEDDAPVKFGDMALIDGEADMVEAVQLWIHGRPVIHGDGGSQQLERGERVKRPAPKVLDADGVEIREKRDVWWICEGDERGVHAERLRVETIGPNGLIECSPYNGGTWVYLEPSELYVNKPVLASDGKPLREGETVFDKDTGDRFEVNGFSEDGFVVCWDLDKCEADIEIKAEQLTHERPVADTWERITEDIASPYCADYCIKYGVDHSSMSFEYAKACDLVRRAKKLAERDA